MIMLTQNNKLFKMLLSKLVIYQQYGEFQYCKVLLILKVNITKVGFIGWQITLTK